jgi:N-acyl-D-amino-acid deacylase
MTTLVRNVQIVLSGSDAVKRADILISGNKISAIGSFPKKQSDLIIDGQGCYASPGFIDVHDNSDHYGKFFEREAWEGALRNGITTVICGHEGVSLAPFRKNSFSLFRPWSDVSGLASNWQTMKEFLKYVADLKLPVNIASFAGLDSLFLGFENKKSDVLAGALISALNGGAAGISIDLAGARERLLFTKEVQEFLKLISARNKIFSLRLDAREEIEPQMKAVALFFSKADCRFVVSCLALSHKRFGEVRALFETYFGKNKNAFFDGGTLAGAFVEASRFLPGWVFNKDQDVMEQLRDDWIRKRIIADIDLPGSKLFVVYANSHDDLVGHTLEDIARRFEVGHNARSGSGNSGVISRMSVGAEDRKLALIELLRATRLRASLYVANDRTLDALEDMPQENIFSDKKNLFGSFSAGVFHSLHAIALGSHALARPYGTLVENANKKGVGHVSSLVDALTRRPASFYALKERGELREGYFADIVIFGSEIKYTLVNGVVAYDGLRTFASPGSVLAF